MIVYHRFSTLPLLVKSFSFNNDGWIVGGGAKYLLGISHEQPRDWDILIPLENWDQACKVIPLGSKTNSFGGIKIKQDGIEIDVWADSLSHFINIQHFHPNYAINLKSFNYIVMNNEVKY